MNDKTTEGRLANYIEQIVSDQDSGGSCARQNLDGTLRHQLRLTQKEIDDVHTQIVHRKVARLLGAKVAIRLARDIVNRDWAFPSWEEECSGGEQS